MTKVLAILEAGDRWPSGVVRALVYRDLFARDGFDVEFVSRLAMRALDAVEWLPSHRLKMAILEGATRANELRILSKAANADMIYLSKVVTSRFLRRLRRRTKGRIVLDFGDAVWLDRDGQRRDGEFRNVLQLVDAVTTDNKYTAEYVRGFGKSCTVIPDSPQLEEFDKKRMTRRVRTDGKVIVGWIGTLGTLDNVDLIAEALHDVSRRRPEMHLRFVGVGNDRSALRAFERLSFSVRPSYSQAEMIEEVFDMDVGLFPLKDTEQSHVRGVLKATIYMAGEAAVIASPIGQVPDVIRDGENGLLARSSEEWIDKLDAMIGDAALRRRLADGGLETVRHRFRTHQSWSLLRGVLRGEEVAS